MGACSGGGRRRTLARSTLHGCVEHQVVGVRSGKRLARLFLPLLAGTILACLLTPLGHVWRHQSHWSHGPWTRLALWHPSHSLWRGRRPHRRIPGQWRHRRALIQQGQGWQLLQ
jgi:hypothetical protein